MIEERIVALHVSDISAKMPGFEFAGRLEQRSPFIEYGNSERKQAGAKLSDTNTFQGSLGREISYTCMYTDTSMS